MRFKNNRLLLGGCVVFGLLGTGVVLDQMCPPDLSRLRDVSKELHGEAGELLYVSQTPDEKWRLRAQFDKVDPLYLNMLVSREDRYFWQHIGVNPLSFLRAAYQAVTEGKIVSGGSTITMQVARLLEPRPRTIMWKMVQAFRALQLELRYSKKEILEMYLTLAPFGSNMEGARSASLAYFGKNPSRLIPSEAALLVALPQSPKLWQRNGFAPKTLEARNRVLAQAFESGLIDEETYKVACLDPLPDARFAMPREVPHLARRLLAEDISDTTIRPALQHHMETVAQSAVRLLPPEVNVAVLVVHHPTQRVVAYVGSSDFFDAGRQGQVDFIRAYRSPGSTLKPFIYGLGFDHGLLNPNSYVLDDRMRFGAYKPDNFDKAFYGMITVSDALIYSLNIPAVELLSQIGPMRFLGTLEEAGISPRFPDTHSPPGLSLALGGVGMTLEQLVSLYAALPQDGLVRPLKFMKGEAEASATRLLSARSAGQLTEILSQTLTNELGQCPQEIAVKTGTSYGYRDAWAVGYNGEYVVGVWIGKPDGSPFGVGTGRTLAVPVLTHAFQYLPSEQKLKFNTTQGDLRLLDASLTAHHRSKKLLKQSPQMLFPVDGTVIEAFDGKGAKSITFSALGGKRPYTWMVDGSPIARNVWNPKTVWKPEKPGFYRISLLDAEGLCQSASVEVQ